MKINTSCITLILLALVWSTPVLPAPSEQASATSKKEKAKIKADKKAKDKADKAKKKSDKKKKHEKKVKEQAAAADKFELSEELEHHGYYAKGPDGERPHQKLLANPEPATTW